MAIDDVAFRRLVDLGRDKGFVTLDQVKEALPIDRMGQRELAETLDRLEQSGVSVELDEELTARPRNGGGDGASEMADFRLPDPQDAEGDRVVPLRPRQAVGTGAPVPPRGAPSELGVQSEPVGGSVKSTSPTRTVVVLALAVLLLILVFILVKGS
jgi:hypothetical protein